jgi:alanyl-tRNA synthetase
VRRIEALTGEAAMASIQTTTHLLQETARLIKEKPETVPKRIKDILSQQRSVDKENEALKAKLSAVSIDSSVDNIKQINGIQVLSRRVSVDNPAALRDLANKFKEKISTGVLVLGSKVGGKAILISVVTKDLIPRLHAGDIIKEIAAIVGGKGGGRPDMAQAGGTQPENLDKALGKVFDMIEKNL